MLSGTSVRQSSRLAFRLALRRGAAITVSWLRRMSALRWVAHSRRGRDKLRGLFESSQLRSARLASARYLPSASW